MLANPLFVVAVALVVGLCVGSFLNVVVHRLPKMMERDWRAQCAELRGEPPPAKTRRPTTSPSRARRVPTADIRIGALENIPLVSWLRAARRVQACRKPISVRYPLVEALGGLLAAYAIWRFGLTWKGGAACVFLWMLIALTFIDFDTQLLPDNLTLPLLWAGLVANLFGLFVSLQDAVLGAIAGYLALWIVYWLFRLIRGKEGMGYGDFKLLAALGAWLGWQMLPLIILLSSVVGAVDRHLADGVQGPRPQHSAGVRSVPRDRRRRRALLRSAVDQGLVFVTRPRVRSYLIGLTGGIGSGKSEVAAAFAALAAPTSSTPTKSRTRSAGAAKRATAPSSNRSALPSSAPTASSIARRCDAAHSTIRRFAAISSSCCIR